LAAGDGDGTGDFAAGFDAIHAGLLADPAVVAVDVGVDAALVAGLGELHVGRGGAVNVVTAGVAAGALDGVLLHDFVTGAGVVVEVAEVAVSAAGAVDADVAGAAAAAGVDFHDFAAGAVVVDVDAEVAVVREADQEAILGV